LKQKRASGLLRFNVGMKTERPPGSGGYATCGMMGLLAPC
jgi:hypothetical protein